MHFTDTRQGIPTRLHGADRSNARLSRTEHMSKIAVAMSGGVDSSLTALLLRDAGHDVIGVTMQLQHDSPDSEVCAGDHDVIYASQNAKFLGIEHHVCKVCDIFPEIIFRPAWDDYSHARTPSPCVRCNEFIKFGILLDFALSLGCDAMATGHYVRVVDYQNSRRIARGLDPRKDQSYFLSGISNKVTPRVLFPLGGLVKTEVRELAAKYGLPSAETPDSQNICIIQNGRTFAEALRDMFNGEIVQGYFTMHGKKLRPHKGIHQYTVGQRHGLGDLVPQKISFVKAIGPENVEITTDPHDLDHTSLHAYGAIWHVDHVPDKCFAQIRYRSPAVSCTTKRDGDKVFVTFDTPVHAATPGQIIAFYDGDTVIGRAIIDSAC